MAGSLDLISPTDPYYDKLTSNRNGFGLSGVNGTYDEPVEHRSNRNVVGREVYAIASGKIEVIDDQGFNVYHISDDGTKWKIQYMHVAHGLVGGSVSLGAFLGYYAMIGFSYDIPHLHIGIGRMVEGATDWRPPDTLIPRTVPSL